MGNIFLLSKYGPPDSPAKKISLAPFHQIFHHTYFSSLMNTPPQKILFVVQFLFITEHFPTDLLNICEADLPFHVFFLLFIQGPAGLSVPGPPGPKGEQGENVSPKFMTMVHLGSSVILLFFSFRKGRDPCRIDH